MDPSRGGPRACRGRGSAGLGCTEVAFCLPVFCLQQHGVGSPMGGEATGVVLGLHKAARVRVGGGPAASWTGRQEWAWGPPARWS